MEEDIKILEETIKLNGKRIQPEIINAMENLMNKAKEQEKIIKQLVEWLQETGTFKNMTIEEVYEYTLKVIGFNEKDEIEWQKIIEDGDHIPRID